MALHGLCSNVINTKGVTWAEDTILTTINNITTIGLTSNGIDAKIIVPLFSKLLQNWQDKSYSNTQMLFFLYALE